MRSPLSIPARSAQDHRPVPPTTQLIVEPAERPGWFIARLDGGAAILARSRTPLADGARRLLELGFDPAGLVTLRHIGAAHDAFRPAPIAELAKWSYAEGERTPLQRQRWKPRQMPVAACPEDQKSSSAAEPALKPVRREFASMIAGTAATRGRP